MAVEQKNGKTKEFTTEIGGKKLVLQTGLLAHQADASVVARYGDTVVLATVVMGKEPREGMDYFPLMVDYEEKLYAAGKIKGSRFIKREGRPTDEAMLTARLVDRAIRPLFPQEIKNDVQVILTVLSWDQENDPDIVGLIAASAALTISGVPWSGPISGIRVGQVEGEWVINPSYEARDKSVIDITVAGTSEKVIMLEAGANEASEEVTYGAIEFALKHMKKPIDLISEMKEALGVKTKTLEEVMAKAKKNEEDSEESADDAGKLNEVLEDAKSWLDKKLGEELFNSPKASKIERKAIFGQVKNELAGYLLEKQYGKDKRKKALELVDKFVEAKVTEAIIKEEKRVDGRKLNEIRSLHCEVGLLPRTHGSGLFSRGDTQVLSVVTLGAPSDEQTLDTMEEEGKKRYMHHYNFPPYSVGEVKPLRGTNRREVGHGALAEKALLPVLPDKEKFPYAIRVVSEVMASNGSSSMGSTCGSSLALMDAGVPIKKAVAGIAMGLASDESGNHKILTDLQDMEDGKGGMDFKVAGTKDGITAIQLDTKTHGLTMEIVKETLERAKDARMEILSAMDQAIAASREELSQYAPRIYSLRINPDSIRNVIGPGGKQIHEIIDATGVDIDIEDDGLVMITATNAEGAERAVQWVKDLTREAKPGEIFKGKVVRLMDFGAFVEILPKQDGLVHISEMAPYRVNQVTDIVKLGQEVTVKVIKIDEKGRINLSMKQAQQADAGDKGNPSASSGSAKR